MGSGFIEYSFSDPPKIEWAVLSAYFDYRISPSETLHVEQSPVWCDQCDSFTIGESIPSAEQLTERLLNIANSDPETIKVLRFCNIDPTTKINDLKSRIRWRASRESPPRCLLCGSAENEPVPHTGEFRHPNTSELVTVTTSGWCDASPEYAEFTPVGIRLTESETAK